MSPDSSTTPFRWTLLALVGASACADRPVTSEPSAVTPPPHFNHNSAAGAGKDWLKGWLDGEEVSVHYTKSYFCAEPPESAAASGCEIGEAATIAPRKGDLPTVYAIAAAGGIQIDPSTLACPAGSQCLNHPAHLDASRIGGPASVGGVPHSHVLAERNSGWHQVVNIRVFNAAVWNEIVATKSLERVRQLQADPAVGGAGLISADTPTNIYFFFQVQFQKPER